MITIKLTVPDSDHAQAIIEHIMCDGMMYVALPLTIEITEETEEVEEE